MIFSKSGPESIREKTMRKVLAARNLSCKVFLTIPLKKHNEPTGLDCFQDWKRLLNQMDITLRNNDVDNKFECVKFLSDPINTDSCVWYEECNEMSLEDLKNNIELIPCEILRILIAIVKFIKDFIEVWQYTQNLH